jgi:D-glycero-alpha-D-manno-heptose-7-phosphate kinase
MLIATAPTRIDLAGGTIDIWPIGHLLARPGCTVNVAINRRARVEVEARDDGEVRLVSVDRGTNTSYPSDRPDHTVFPLASQLVQAIAPGRALELRVESTVPGGSGLGGSSALAVAIGSALARFAGYTWPAEQFLRVIQNVETRLLDGPTGYQDYYPPLFGGVQSLTAMPSGVERRTIAAAPEMLKDHLLLVDTQLEHHSGMNNWEVVRAFLDGDRSVRTAMNRINECAVAMEDALDNQDLAAAASALDGEWQARRTLAPVVSNERIEALMAAARDSGALAGKVCGAGGGGCIAFLVDPAQQDAVHAALVSEGGAMVEFAIDSEGVQLSES